MLKNIVAEIKISRAPLKLAEVLLDFFLPDLEALELRIYAKTDTVDEVLYQAQLPYQLDLVKVLWQECAVYLEEQPKQPLLEKAEIKLLVAIQLQHQNGEESFPTLKLLINPHPTASGAIVALDFGERDSYSTPKTLPQSGRLLDTTLILAVLELLCEQIDLESLYVLDPNLDSIPWNYPFVFHRYPRAYIEDLQLILGIWSNPEQFEPASLFGERDPEQITQLNQFLTFYHQLLKRKDTSISLLSNELVTLWQDTLKSLGELSTFSIFEPSEGFGVGIYSSTFLEGYCDQPYLALLKYLCTPQELLLPEDIDSSLAPPEIPEVTEEESIAPEPESEPEPPAPPPPTVQERVAALIQDLVLPKSPPLHPALNPDFETEIAFQPQRNRSGHIQRVLFLYGAQVSDADLREHLLRFRAYQDLNLQWYRLHQYKKDYEQWFDPKDKKHPSKIRNTVAFTVNQQFEQLVTQLSQQLDQWENGALHTTPASDLQQAVTECHQHLQSLQYAVQGLVQLPSYGFFNPAILQAGSDFRRQHLDTLTHFLADAPNLEPAIDDFFSHYYVTPDDPPQLHSFQLNDPQQLVLTTETTPWEISAIHFSETANWWLDYRQRSVLFLPPPDGEAAFRHRLEYFGVKLPRFAELSSPELAQVLSQYCAVTGNMAGKHCLGLGPHGTEPGLWLRWGTLGAGAPPDTPLTQIWESCLDIRIWILITGTVGYPTLKMLPTETGWVQEGTRAYLDAAIAQMATIDDAGLQKTLVGLTEALERKGVRWHHYHGHRDAATGVIQGIESRQFVLFPPVRR